MISVVIPTLNRSDSVVATVQELLRSNSRYLQEIIIVDQSDIPNRELSGLGDSRIRYFFVEFRNLPRARNFGVSAATSPFILFVDDDVTGLDGLVDAHYFAHINFLVDVVTGPVLPRADKDLIPAELVRLERRVDILEGKCYNELIDVSYVPSFAAGANSSYRKNIFSLIGGFDENFVGGAIGEDAEMSHRIKLGFGKILFFPEAKVIHLALQSGGCRDVSFVNRRTERLLNLHYFYHKINKTKGLKKVMLREFKYEIASVLKRNRLEYFKLPERLFNLSVAWVKARKRTRLLLRNSHALRHPVIRPRVRFEGGGAD
jgi:glycosyltransferase involved in cell wall biosynthesis